MYVIEVIPFARGAHVDSLTYYAADAYTPGTVVTVPLRKKEIRGMVLDCQPVSTAKTAIRAATFSLRKMPEQESATPLPPALIATAEKLTETMPTTVGALLYALLPPEVRDGSVTLHADVTPTATGSTVSVLEARIDERYRAYRSRIREAFAHRGSVMLIVPTSVEVEYAYETLARGIAERIITFSPTYGAKKLARAYESFHDVSRAKLIIATPKHAFLDRHDITDVIVESSRSPYYRSRVRPYADTRDVLKTLARVTGRTVLLGDLLPNTEDEQRRRDDVYATEGEHPNRITFSSTLKVVTQNDKPTAESPFALFSEPVLNAVEKTMRGKQRMFMLAARRGLAPVVACVDCGHVFRCPDSGAPYSLLRTERNGEEERWFVSGTSGKRVRAADTCAQCGSWRLRERGIGIQHIYDELKEHVDESAIILFDHTTATTHTKARTLIAKFYETKGAILLATPMVLPYIESPVHHSAIISLDATRSIPSWRADEELFSLLLTLRERTEGVVYVQTRTEPDTLLDYAARGHVSKFYDDELALRKALGYPPYGVLVHLAFEASNTASVEERIRAALAPTNVTFYTPAQAGTDSKLRNGLIRIPVEHWPDTDLLARLRTLPPSIRIEINPHRIV